MRKVSKKQSKRLRKYKTVRVKYLEDNPECERCGGVATQVHHAKGKIDALLIDISYFVSVCFECHRWIEEHPVEAKEQGLSESRLAI